MILNEFRMKNNFNLEFIYSPSCLQFNFVNGGGSPTVRFKFVVIKSVEVIMLLVLLRVIITMVCWCLCCVAPLPHGSPSAGKPLGVTSFCWCLCWWDELRSGKWRRRKQWFCDVWYSVFVNYDNSDLNSNVLMPIMIWIKLMSSSLSPHVWAREEVIFEYLLYNFVWFHVFWIST